MGVRASYMADETEGSNRPIVGCPRISLPGPVAKAREALEGLDEGAVLEVLADDPETLHDMPMLIGRGPHRLVHVGEHHGEIRFLIEVAPQ